MAVTDDAGLKRILSQSRRIAVLGIKPESRADRPAHFVPKYLARAGYEVIPVPVHYPEVTEIFGGPVYRRLADVPGSIDVVQVFRKPGDVPQHVADIISRKPRVVWMQSGIRHDDAAAAFEAAGIEVVQDRCMMIEHERLL
jgi:predicted CoA-binding protein